MKERNVLIHCLVLLMLIAGLAACASSRTSESTGEYVDDSVITTKVKALLAEDDFLKVIPDQCRNVQRYCSTERLR